MILKGMILIYLRKELKFYLSKKPICLGKFKCQDTTLVTFLLVSLQLLIEKSMQHTVLIIFLWTLILVLLHYLLGKCLLSISYG